MVGGGEGRCRDAVRGSAWCSRTTVEADEVQAFEDATCRVAARMRGTNGHVREELLRDPGTTTYHLYAEWEDEASFEAWVADPDHRDQSGGPVALFLGTATCSGASSTSPWMPGQSVQTHIAEPEGRERA